MPVTRPARWRATVAALAAALVAAPLGVSLAQPVAAAPPAVTRAAAPTLDWRPCRDGFECARVEVPLDYDAPDRATVTVSVIRLPAGDPDRRVGALFLNPGGPGGSGVEFARQIAPVLPLELRGRFDIVGLDPRGISRSTPLRCYRTFEQSFSDQPPMVFPTTTKQESRWIKANRRFAAACEKRGRPILDHMSTADVARDMDQIRAAMGDPQLSYLGLSYGSVLGQTYANLFPGRSRAIVVDGVLDPVAWTSGGAEAKRLPVTARVDSAVGARATLRAFFELCDEAGRRCAFSGGAKERYIRLARKLQRRPIDLGWGYRINHADLIAMTLGGLYSSYYFPDLAEILAELELMRSIPAVRGELRSFRRTIGLAQEPYENLVEGFPGVLCADSTNPRNFARWRVAADAMTEEQGRFARLWMWQGGPCAPWSQEAGADRYAGPWTRPTANPVLVVGNSYDPATPYSGAQAAARLLPNSRLLTYTGWGHTAFLSGNYCVDAAVTAYFADGVLPADGTVCRPAGSPFGRLAARGMPATARAVAKALAPSMPAAVRRALDPRG